jgi:DNA-binding transcriptional MerR regulator
MLIRLSDASEASGIPPRTLRNWIRRGLIVAVQQKHTTEAGEPAQGKPGYYLPFASFAEAATLRGLRNRGLPLQRLSRVIDSLRERDFQLSSVVEVVRLGHGCYLLLQDGDTVRVSDEKDQGIVPLDLRAAKAEVRRYAEKWKIDRSEWPAWLAESEQTMEATT